MSQVLCIPNKNDFVESVIILKRELYELLRTASGDS